MNFMEKMLSAKPFKCPNCGQELPLADVNVAQDVALCRACNYTGSFLAAATVPRLTDEELARPPKRVSLKREFGDIPKVACYPQQLNQVFLNLLVNAAHALGETHGEITVRTEQAGDWILIKVSDTGCGIPEEIRTRIFEPFFTTKEVGKGTGLGLSISYDIIKKHGGSIEIQSEVGRGTTFTVRLPIGHHHGEQ